MLIAQISDLHIAPAGQLTFGHAPMAENLASVVDHINALAQRPDVVLVTGDIANSKRLDETERAAEILNRLRCPYYVTTGNHDSRAAMLSVFGGAACPDTDGPFLSYVVPDFPVTLIALDSVMEGAAGGQLCPQRLDWLRARLVENGGKPAIVFLHHPPVRLGVPESDLDGFDGADALGDIVAAHPEIMRILCGHIHLNTHTLWRDRIVTTAPSIGMKLALDFDLSHESRFVLDAPEYLLHHWAGSHQLVTHLVRVAETDGPFPFAERRADDSGI